MRTAVIVVSYLFVLGCVLIFPTLLYIVLRCIEKSHRLSAAVAAILLVSELICGTILYFKPIYICPKQYEDFIPQERHIALKNGESPGNRGFLSNECPVLAIVNEVTYASEGVVHVRTWYFPLGRSTTGVNGDGLYRVDD